MIFPLDPSHPITQLYGENPLWYPATHGHNGLDFGCPEGTPIWTTQPGLVIFAGLDPATIANPKTGYGLHVRIQTSQFLIILAHLSKLQIQRDDQVTAGQVIGLSGNTGNSTGPHLHFELRTASSLATCIDPFPLLDRKEKVTLRNPIFTALVTCEELNIRPTPSTNFPPTGTLSYGETIQVVNILGPNIWVQHDRGYSAFRFNDVPYMGVKDE